MTLLPINKSLIIERFSKAIHTYSREASVQRRIAEKMIRLLQHQISTPCRKVVEFGCGTGIYSRMILQSIRPEQLLLNDICHEMKDYCKDLLNERVTFLPGDAENVSFPKETELITSCSTLQWFESPESFFHRCNALLTRQGHFAFSTFGKQNMKEIRQLTRKGLPYRSRQELEIALSPYFHIVHSEEEIISLTFDTPLQVLYHLKQTGVTGTSQHRWTRQDLNHFCEQYLHLFSNNNSVSLTYHPIYIIAKKKEK